jgi:F420-0:gamma-glutamyl ligase
MRCVQTGHVKTGKVTISDTNVPTWRDGFVGMGIKSADVQAYHEKWETIEKCLTRR